MSSFAKSKQPSFIPNDFFEVQPNYSCADISKGLREARAKDLAAWQANRENLKKEAIFNNV